MSLLVGVLGYAGLALSVSCSALVQIAVLWVIAQRRYGPLGLAEVGKSLVVLAITALASVGAGLGVWHLGSFTGGAWSRIAGVMLAIFVAALLYLGITWLLGYRHMGGVRRKPGWSAGAGSSDGTVEKGV
jgi:peptidoglycan biosynthesis protein MviN/MurJ (putative lipid II flippase)